MRIIFDMHTKGTQFVEFTQNHILGFQIWLIFKLVDLENYLGFFLHDDFFKSDWVRGIKMNILYLIKYCRGDVKVGSIEPMDFETSNK